MQFLRDVSDYNSRVVVSAPLESCGLTGPTIEIESQPLAVSNVFISDVADMENRAAGTRRTGLQAGYFDSHAADNLCQPPLREMARMPGLGALSSVSCPVNIRR